MNGHLGCFHVLAIEIASAATNTEVHMSFSVVGYMPSSGIAGSYGSFSTSLIAQLVKIPPAMQETSF